MSLTDINPASLVEKLDVAYIESQEETNRLITNFLQKRVRKVYSTDNPEYAVELFLDKNIDLIITEIQTPCERFLNAVKILRKKHKNAKVIFTSDQHKEELFLKAIESNAEGFLIKPISPNTTLQPLLNKVAIQIHKERLLKEYTDTLRLILDYIDSMIVVTDGEKLFNCNNAFLTYFQCENFSCFTQQHPNLSDIFICQEEYICGPHWLQRLQQTPFGKVKIKHRTFLASAKSIDTTSHKYVVNFTDITKLEHQRRVLMHNAHTDTLTGTLNRDSFQKLYDKELDLITKTKSTFCVVFFNIADLGRINKTLGHHRADEILKNTAKLVQSALEPTQTLARWAGGEFVILMPHSSAEDAHKLIDQLQEAIDKTNTTAKEKITCHFAMQEVSEDISLQRVFDYLSSNV